MAVSTPGQLGHWDLETGSEYRQDQSITTRLLGPGALCRDPDLDCRRNAATHSHRSQMLYTDAIDVEGGEKLDTTGRQRGTTRPGLEAARQRGSAGGPPREQGYLPAPTLLQPHHQCHKRPRTIDTGCCFDAQNRSPCLVIADPHSVLPTKTPRIRQPVAIV